MVQLSANIRIGDYFKFSRMTI